MVRSRRKRNKQGSSQRNERLRKYLVTILPTFTPIEILATNPDEAEELASHYWDVGWEGEFVTKVEEIERDCEFDSSNRPKSRSAQIASLLRGKS